MNTRKLTLLFTALVGMAVSAFAQSTATEATVARVTGTVTATLADGSSVAVTEGSKLPQGATITTGDKSEAYLVSHGDTTSVITANSVVQIAELSTSSAGGKVTEQKATLDLKSGNIVAKLNPAKKSVNQYSVRTPKGVAAARGTVFSVTYKGQSYKISVVNGNVSFDSALGGTVSISNGQTSLDGQVVPIGVPGQDSLATEAQQELAVIAATVAVAAANGIGGTTSAESAAIIRTIIAAVPEAAPAIASLVAASAPSQSAAVTEITREVAPQQSTAVEQATRESTPTTTTNPTTGETTTTPATTAPQPIDPSTISRSN